MKVYPNPTAGSFVVEIDSKQFNEWLLRIFDFTGKAIVFERIKVHPGENKIHLSINKEHPEGIYYAVLQTANEVFNQKILKISSLP